MKDITEIPGDTEQAKQTPTPDNNTENTNRHESTKDQCPL